MTELSESIAEIKRVTQDDIKEWTATIAADGHPNPSPLAGYIATILNAVASGELVLTADVDGLVVPEWMAKHTFAVQHNPNCPSPWLVRMPGKSAVIDMKPYATFGAQGPDQLTVDILGFGKTLADAARAALLPQATGGDA